MGLFVIKFSVSVLNEKDESFPSDIGHAWKRHCEAAHLQQILERSPILSHFTLLKH